MKCAFPLFIAVWLLKSPAAYARSDYWYEHSDDTRFWVNAGVGGGYPSFSSSISANWQSKHWPICQLGLVHNSTFQLIGGTPEESVTSVSLLVGARTQPSIFTAAGFFGLGVVNGFHRGDDYLGGGGYLGGGNYSQEPYSVVGLVSNAQLFWKPTMTFGLGLQANVCLNTELTFSSLQLSIHLGSDR
ncbi:MAG: hypothetical protein WC326_13225 [Candidatus Delongbacteria bacterium]